MSSQSGSNRSEEWFEGDDEVLHSSSADSALHSALQRPMTHDNARASLNFNAHPPQQTLARALQVSPRSLPTAAFVQPGTVSASVTTRNDATDHENDSEAFIRSMRASQMAAVELSSQIASGLREGSDLFREATLEIDRAQVNQSGNANVLSDFRAFLTRLRSAVDRHPSSQQSEALSTNTPSIEHQPRENLNMRAADDHAAPEGPLVVPPGLDADVPSWAEERMRRINHARQSLKKVEQPGATVFVMTCRGSGCGAVVCHRGLRSAPRSRVRRRPTSPEEADSSDEVPVPESDDSTQTFFWTSDSAPAPYTTCMFQAEYETLGQVCRCRRFGLGCRKCGHELGFYVAKACETCCKDESGNLKAYSPDLYAFFYYSAAVSLTPRRRSERPYIHIWGDIPSKMQDFRDGLTDDPVLYISEGRVPFWARNFNSRHDVIEFGRSYGNTDVILPDEKDVSPEERELAARVARARADMFKPRPLKKHQVPPPFSVDKNAVHFDAIRELIAYGQFFENQTNEITTTQKQRHDPER